MKFSSIILGLVVALLPNTSWSQIPDFQELDINGDGKITEEEYDNSNSGLEEDAEDESKNEVDTQSINSYIGIQERFLTGDGAFFGRSSSILSTGGADPGRFSYTFISDEDIFAADLALMFKFLSIDRELGESEDKWIPALYALPVFEAHVSSSDDAENSLQFQFPFVFSFTEDVEDNPNSSEVPKGSFINSHYLIGSPLYQTDKEFETSVIGFDVLYTPGIPKLGIGSPIRKEKETFRFRWRPLVGFELGQVLNDGGNDDALPAETFIRATARVRAELLIIDRLTFSADYIWRIDLNGDNDVRDFVDLTATYFLDELKNVSIGLSYTNGRNTPQFVNVDELSTFLGFKL